MQNNDTNKASIIFIGLQLLFAVFCAVTIPRLFTSNIMDMDDVETLPSIEINDLSSTMPDAESKDEKTMKVMLLNAIQNNIPEVDLKTTTGIIREGSVKSYYFELQNVYYYSAIIDIPELQQSYFVFHEYSDDILNSYLSENDQYVIQCLMDEQDIIYPDFDCKDNFGQKTYNAIAQKYLEWFEFDDFFIYKIENYDIVTIIALKNDAETNSQKYIEETETAISSLGLPDNLFEYEVINIDDAPYVYWSENSE